jgi:hypothetical protein
MCHGYPGLKPEGRKEKGGKGGEKVLKKGPHGHHHGGEKVLKKGHHGHHGHHNHHHGGE